MSAHLGAWLMGERVLPQATIQQAQSRQLVYGGALDTAILEMGAMTESAVWARLAAATGYPVPPLELCEEAAIDTPPALAADRTSRLRAVPVASDARTLKLLCAEPVAADEIRLAAAEHGFEAQLYVVPEVRLLAARQRVYGEPLPARFAPLLARIVGTEQARRSYSYRARRPGQDRQDRTSAPLHVAATGTTAPRPPIPAAGGLSPLPDFMSDEPAPLFDAALPTPLEHVLDLSGPLPPDSSLEVEIDLEPPAGYLSPDPADASVRLELISSLPAPESEASVVVAESGPPDPTGDAATEALCRRARDWEDKGRTLALRALRRRLTHPPVQSLLEELRAAAATGEGTIAVHAVDALGEIRDRGALATLMARMTPATPADIHDAAHRALVAITVQDFGKSRPRWQTWARSNADRQRTEWLLDGLMHKQASLRSAASEELRQVSGESFGYVFDLPKREREEARQRWIAWWQQTSQETSGRLAASENTYPDTGRDSADTNTDKPGGDPT